MEGVVVSYGMLYYASTSSWNIYFLAFPSIWIERLKQLGWWGGYVRNRRIYRFRVLWTYLGLLQDGRVYGFALGMGL